MSVRAGFASRAGQGWEMTDPPHNSAWIRPAVRMLCTSQCYFEERDNPGRGPSFNTTPEWGMEQPGPNSLQSRSQGTREQPRSGGLSLLLPSLYYSSFREQWPDRSDTELRLWGPGSKSGLNTNRETFVESLNSWPLSLPSLNEYETAPSPRGYGAKEGLCCASYGLEQRLCIRARREHLLSPSPLLQISEQICSNRVLCAWHRAGY